MEKNKIFLSLFLIGILFSLTLVVSADQNNTTISREDAVRAINDSQLIIENMKNNNFSVNYASDLLVEAKRNLQTVDYAEVIRNDSATPIQKAEASQALNLIDWKNINYSVVIESTNNIKEAQKQVFLILDSLSAITSRIDNEKKLGTDTSNSDNILQQARDSFNAERYNESLSLIANANSELDRSAGEKARLSILKYYSINFFQSYWYYLLGAFILIFIIFLFLRGKIKKYNLIKKITHMKAEQQVLTNLVMQTQRERYKENKISSLVYNIRINKYHERMNEIKESLPVLEANLYGKKPKHVKISR